MEVKCYLKKLVEPILLLVFNNIFAGFVTFYFALCLILAYSNIVRTYEMLLTYDLHMRNTDPCFHLVSCYKKHLLVSNKKCCFLSAGTYCMFIESSVHFLQQVVNCSDAVICKLIIWMC